MTVCVNHITVSGKALEVVHFMNECTKGPIQWQQRRNAWGKNYFTLHSLVPIPDYLLRSGKRHSLSRPEQKLGDVTLHQRIATEEDWGRLHWGCANDVGDQKITKKKMNVWYGDNDQATLDFSFETFDNPPLRWYETVFALFPTLKFQIHYELRGQFAHGYVMGLNGVSWESDVLTESVSAFTCDSEE